MTMTVTQEQDGSVNARLWLMVNRTCHATSIVGKGRKEMVGIHIKISFYLGFPKQKNPLTVGLAQIK